MVGTLAGTVLSAVLVATRRLRWPDTVRHIAGLVVAFAVCLGAMFAWFRLVQDDPLSGWPLWVGLGALVVGIVILGIRLRPRVGAGSDTPAH